MEAFRKVKAARRGVKLVIVGSGPMLAELQAGADADCHFEPAVAECGAVAAGDGHFRAALAIRSAVQFADGSDGLRLLPGRVGYGRQSGIGAGWRDGAAISVGDAEALAARLARLLDEPEYRRRLAAPSGAADARAIHAGAGGAGRWAQIYQEFLSRMPEHPTLRTPTTSEFAGSHVCTEWHRDVGVTGPRASCGRQLEERAMYRTFVPGTVWVVPGCEPWFMRSAGVPPAPDGVGIGDLLLLLRVEDEFPLLVQGAVVVDLHALAFGCAGYARDAAADRLGAGIALRHASGAGSGQNVADHVGCRVALAGYRAGLGKAGRSAVRPGLDRIGRHAAGL